MGSYDHRFVALMMTLSFLFLVILFLVILPVLAADQEIDRLLRSPVGKDWVTNGGNLTNQRYSTLNQIDTSNVAQLKGAWMTRLKGSGFDAKYSFEATPLVKNGIMYVITGNNDVFALNAKTGTVLWEYWSDVDKRISALCCGWVNRGLAMGEGLLFFGQLDANVVALDMKTGKVVWKTSIEKWENGYSITSAPLYYDGIVFSGIGGGEFGVRGRLTALDAKTGAILWRWYTVPGSGEFGGDTWPPDTDHAMRGGATVWNTPALDPELGLIYFVTGNCGPNHDGSMREGDNLFCASMIALKAKTGEYVWHFQQVHHDIWNYDASSPMVLFDTVINGQPRKGIAEAGHLGREGQLLSAVISQSYPVASGLTSDEGAIGKVRQWHIDRRALRRTPAIKPVTGGAGRLVEFFAFICCGGGCGHQRAPQSEHPREFHCPAPQLSARPRKYQDYPTIAMTGLVPVILSCLANR